MKLRFIMLACPALMLASCATVLFSVNRTYVAQSLTKAKLGIPDSLAEAIAEAIPRQVANRIERMDRDDGAGLFIKCLALDSAGAESREYVCVGRGQRWNQYVGIFTRRDGRWRAAWDTVYTCHYPSRQIDTVRLGIETTWRPTIQLRGTVHYRGRDEYHFIGWDGTNARQLIHRFARGHWLELMDIDGDGIMEINIPRTGQESGTWRDRVYTFKPRVGQYWLDGKVTFPPDTGSLEFEVSIPRDTFLTNEAIWVSFEASNTTRVSFPNMLLTLSSSDIQMIVYNEHEEEVGGDFT